MEYISPYGKDFVKTSDKEHGADVTFIGSNGLDASNLYVNYLKNLYKKLRESKEKIKNITGICLKYKHETLNIKDLEMWDNILSSYEPDLLETRLTRKEK